MSEQDYNTGRDKLIMAEYGRNIQNMVKFAMSVEIQNLYSMNEYTYW